MGFNGAFIHCQPQQLSHVLDVLGIAQQRSRAKDFDILEVATQATNKCLESLSEPLGLVGPAARNFGTALRSAPVRNLLKGKMARETPVLQVLQWVGAAADAARHLAPFIVCLLYTSPSPRD